MQLHWRKPAPQELDHELLWLTMSLGSGLALAAWLAAQLPTPRCTFYSLTGLPCITCGATRAAIQFFHGHFRTSFLFNPLAFLALCGLIVFDLYALGGRSLPYDKRDGVLVARATSAREAHESAAPAHCASFKRESRDPGLE